MPKVMYVKNKKYLHVGWHEWAFSIRTSGFPIHFWDTGGKLVRSEGTSKQEKYYPLEGVAWITREYYSNSGYLTLYLYNVQGDEVVASKITTVSEAQQLPGKLGEYALEKVMSGNIKG